MQFYGKVCSIFITIIDPRLVLVCNEDVFTYSICNAIFNRYNNSVIIRSIITFYYRLTSFITFVFS